ncbi:hypothetical protein NPJ82_15985 (plasmid) [Sphingomonas sp. NY01]|uniref:hypothetical protein n=1 Tax=Sphingomonas sp. NY01 TaxID=2968057 RepID=UPI00315C783B
MAAPEAGQVDHARTEIRHESQLLIGRLNALLSCQAFLMIAYATSLGSSNGRWSEPFTVTLPPFLALLGFVLAYKAQRGIAAARMTIADWHAQLDALGDASATRHAGEAARGIADRRRNGDRFAMRTSVIFMGAWTVLALLPVWLFLR